MSETSRHLTAPECSKEQAPSETCETFVPTVPTPSMLEDSVLLFRVRKELSRLKRIGDKAAYQAAWDVVAPLLGEQDKAIKAREPY